MDGREDLQSEGRWDVENIGLVRREPRSAESNPRGRQLCAQLRNTPGRGKTQEGLRSGDG